MIERYNVGSEVDEVVFNELIQFMEDLDTESQRAIQGKLHENIAQGCRVQYICIQ